jgi:L-ascorbate metabolism protein UlaG (beta-lactamase superfamily)
MFIVPLVRYHQHISLCVLSWRFTMLRRAALGFVLLIGLLAVNLPATSGERKWAPIKVSWYGQSFFVVESSKGFRIAFDPHLIPEFGRPEGVKANLVLMSHNHNDHTMVEALDNHKDKSLRIIRGLKGVGLRADWNPVDETVGGVHIGSVGLYHDNMEGLQAGKVTAFIVEMDGWRICHLGDLGHLLTPLQVRQIGEVDVLMIPIGGVYTINGSEAKKVVAQIKPREYIFPMHYGTRNFDDLLPATEFLEGQDRNKVAEAEDNKVVLNRDASRPRPLIVTLTYPVEAKRKKAK